MAEQRTKEIRSIRKVLGASVPQVWMLLSKDFIALVVISCVMAAARSASPPPHYWLQLNHNYRISIQPMVIS